MTRPRLLASRTIVAGEQSGRMDFLPLEETEGKVAKNE